MAGLLKEYFKRDLSEAELDKLEALLEDEGKALQLLRLAKKRYKATGLPDPLHKPGFWERWGLSQRYAWTAALAGLLLAVLLPVALRQPAPLPPAPLAPNAPRAMAKRARGSNMEERHLVHAKKAMAMASSAAEPKIFSMERARSIPALVMPGLSLRLLQSGPKWSFGLFVPRPSHILVRILDGQQEVKRVLLDEDLRQGSLALNWDGKDAQGRDLAAGAYTLAVISSDSKADLKIQLP